MNAYEKQAQAFADKNGVKLVTNYLGTYPRLGDYAVAQWNCALTRPGRPAYEFIFSSSLKDSWEYRNSETYKRKQGLPAGLPAVAFPVSAKPFRFKQFEVAPVPEARLKSPTMYDILACLTKSDPGSFEDFCAEYGYDDQPLKEYPRVLGIYQDVCKEYRAVSRMFNDCMGELEDIN